MVRSGLGLLSVTLIALLIAAGYAGQAGQSVQPLIKPESVPVYQPKNLPFEAGEKEVYRATWNGMFAVATAEVQMVPTVVDGKKVFHVRVEAKTASALDMIWKMRDTITSTFDAKGLAPSKFTFSQRENSRIIDTEARYDLNTKRWAVNRQQVGKKPQIYEFDSENTLDPITIGYLVRTIDFKVGDHLYFKVFGGRYRYLLDLLVEKKEMVTLASGKSVEAFRFVPRVQNITKKGYASRVNDAAVWLSADERRLPVKLSSKIVFGTVYLDLVEDKRGTQSAASDKQRPAS